jgi:hypothetical protein
LPAAPSWRVLLEKGVLAQSIAFRVVVVAASAPVVGAAMLFVELTVI